MRWVRRALVLAVALVLVLVLVGLALLVTALVALPLALALELALLALVVGVGTRVQRVARRWPWRRGPGESGSAAGPRWTTGWEAEPERSPLPVVRERLAVVLAEWGLGSEAGEPTLLVVTELVANAAEHGRWPVRLSVEYRRSVVRVEVHDDSPEPPDPLPLDPDRLRGRGLQLVDGLCEEWGWTPDPPGKVVWADVTTQWPN
jgi:anti-sigma regulatory factor (Ser/Thr protein kinase)